MVGDSVKRVLPPTCIDRQIQDTGSTQGSLQEVAQCLCRPSRAAPDLTIGGVFNCSKPEKVTSGDGETLDPQGGLSAGPLGGTPRSVRRRRSLAASQ